MRKQGNDWKPSACLKKKLLLTNTSYWTPTQRFCCLIPRHPTENRKKTLQTDLIVKVPNRVLRSQGLKRQHTDLTHSNRFTNVSLHTRTQRQPPDVTKDWRIEWRLREQRKEYSFSHNAGTANQRYCYRAPSYWTMVARLVNTQPVLNIATVQKFASFHSCLKRMQSNAYLELDASVFHKGCCTKTWTQLSLIQSESAFGNFCSSNVHRFDPITIRFLCTHTL